MVVWRHQALCCPGGWHLSYNVLVKYSDVIGDVSYPRVGPFGKGADREKE